MEEQRSVVRDIFDALDVVELFEEIVVGVMGMHPTGVDFAPS